VAVGNGVSVIGKGVAVGLNGVGDTTNTGNSEIASVGCNVWIGANVGFGKVNVAASPTATVEGMVGCIGRVTDVTMIGSLSMSSDRTLFNKINNKTALTINKMNNVISRNNQPEPIPDRLSRAPGVCSAAIVFSHSCSTASCQPAKSTLVDSCLK
jgi:hypothetical protein